MTQKQDENEAENVKNDRDDVTEAYSHKGTLLQWLNFLTVSSIGPLCDRLVSFVCVSAAN